MKFKLFAAAMIAAILLLALTACGNTQSQTTSDQLNSAVHKQNSRTIQKTLLTKIPLLTGMRIQRTNLLRPVKMRLPRPTEMKQLRKSLGKQRLQRSCLKNTVYFRNTMRIWEMESIRSMRRWAARSFPSSRLTPQQAITTGNTDINLYSVSNEKRPSNNRWSSKYTQQEIKISMADFYQIYYAAYIKLL